MNWTDHCKLTLMPDSGTNGSINDSIGHWSGSVMTKRLEDPSLLSVGQHNGSLPSHWPEVRNMQLCQQKLGLPPAV
jgi:hypothetical protein